MISEKEAAELAFWESRVLLQGVLSNDHFEYFYTAHFGLAREFYKNKKILDIGCGPRGSLEWASEAGVRVGLDPLADAYRNLGTERHAMEYVACGAERIPFPDNFFEVVCSLNSLDHVDDLSRVIPEILRVIAPEGEFLLLTDIHRQPTTLEPSAFSWEIVKKFLPELQIVEERHFEYSVWSDENFGDIYQSLHRGILFDHANPTERYGILSARFRRR